MDDCYTCKFCNDIVEDPKECLSCSQLLCNSCYDIYQHHYSSRLGNKCPNCEVFLSVGKNVNRYALLKLNGSLFTCDKERCYAPQFKYEDRKAHWERCGLVIKCKFCETNFRNDLPNWQAVMKAHWQQTCPEI